MSLKILICGDLKGHIDDLYKKISVIEKKSGKFDVLFCIGDVFGDKKDFLNEYMSKTKFSSLETFLICTLPSDLHDKIDKNGSEICKNITYLGSKGVMKFQNKLHFAFLYSDDINTRDIKEISDHLLCTNLSYTGIDLLFTNLWPAGVENDCESSKIRETSLLSAQLTAALASIVQPRYHFSAGQQSFFERAPYRNQKNELSKPKHVTRFIGLSSFKNEKNEKYLYAMQIKPMELMSQEELLKIPTNSTDNPFTTVNTNSILSISRQQFFYDIPDRKREADTEIEENSKKKRHDTSAKCWFCLGNPEVEKHLIIHVGSEIYLAMPKGPLVDDHFLILTIGHYQSLVTCPTEVSKEVRKTMKKITKYFSSQGKSVVFFERNFKTNHFQMQVVPIDTDKLEICKTLFLEMADSGNGPGENYREIPSRTKLDEIVKQHVPYFYTEFSDGTKFFGSIPRDQLSSFDLQYGRTVLSNKKILNCPEKIEWKNCIQNRDEEESLVKKLKLSLTEIL